MEITFLRTVFVLWLKKNEWLFLLRWILIFLHYGTWVHSVYCLLSVDVARDHKYGAPSDDRPYYSVVIVNDLAIHAC